MHTKRRLQKPERGGEASKTPIVSLCTLSELHTSDGNAQQAVSRGSRRDPIGVSPAPERDAGAPRRPRLPRRDAPRAYLSSHGKSRRRLRGRPGPCAVPVAAPAAAPRAARGASSPLGPQPRCGGTEGMCDSRSAKRRARRRQPRGQDRRERGSGTHPSTCKPRVARPPAQRLSGRAQPSLLCASSCAVRRPIPAPIRGVGTEAAPAPVRRRCRRPSTTPRTASQSTCSE